MRSPYRRDEEADINCCEFGSCDTQDPIWQRLILTKSGPVSDFLPQNRVKIEYEINTSYRYVLENNFLKNFVGMVSKFESTDQRSDFLGTAAIPRDSGLSWVLQ